MEFLIEVFKAIALVITFAAILFLVYVTTRFVGGKAKVNMKSKNMRIVESISLGLDKRIHLLKVGNQYILVASSGKSVEFLTTINLNNDISITEEAEEDNKFGSYLQKYLENLKNSNKFTSKSFTGDSKNEIPKDVIPEDVIHKEDNLFRVNLNRLKNVNTKMDIKVKNDESVNKEKKDI